MCRSALPQLWLALGELYQSRHRQKQALDAFKHGVACDTAYHFHETRVCLLHVCVWKKESGEAGEMCTRWVRLALEKQDKEVKSPEGMECVRTAMEYCKGCGDVELGFVFCEQLLQLQEPACSEIAQHYYPLFTEMKDALNNSISMECSDLLVC